MYEEAYQRSNPATDKTGGLQPINPDQAWIKIPNTSGAYEKFYFYALPEVSESKEAHYSDIQILGRSSPVKTYSFSGYRTLSITFNLPSTSRNLLDYHLRFIRAIASLTHPQYENTYLPPPVAKLKLGTLIGFSNGDKIGNEMVGGGVDVVCMSYQYDMSPEVVWLDKTLLVPIHIALRAEFHVVYPFYDLPGAKDVIGGKY